MESKSKTDNLAARDETSDAAAAAAEAAAAATAKRNIKRGDEERNARSSSSTTSKSESKRKDKERSGEKEEKKRGKVLEIDAKHSDEAATAAAAAAAAAEAEAEAEAARRREHRKSRKADGYRDASKTDKKSQTVSSSDRKSSSSIVSDRKSDKKEKKSKRESEKGDGGKGGAAPRSAAAAAAATATAATDNATIAGESIYSNLKKSDKKSTSKKDATEEDAEILAAKRRAEKKAKKERERGSKRESSAAGAGAAADDAVTTVSAGISSAERAKKKEKKEEKKDKKEKKEKKDVSSKCTGDGDERRRDNGGGGGGDRGSRRGDDSAKSRKSVKADSRSSDKISSSKRDESDEEKRRRMKKEAKKARAAAAAAAEAAAAAAAAAATTTTTTTTTTDATTDATTAAVDSNNDEQDNEDEGSTVINDDVAEVSTVAMVKRSAPTSDGGSPRSAALLDKQYRVAQRAMRLALARKELNSRRKMQAYRTHVVKELLKTEKSYAETLQRCIEFYMRPLQVQMRKSASDGSQALVAANEYRALFGSIEVLAGYANQFLDNLQKFVENEWSSTARLGPLMNEMATWARIYAQYALEFETARQTHDDLYAESEKFKEFCDIQRAKDRDSATEVGGGAAGGSILSGKVSAGLPLPGYLITPIQRLPRYVLLLKDIFKHTWPSHCDYAELKESLAAIENVTNYVNERKREGESIARVAHLKKEIAGLDEVNLITADRRWILEEELRIFIPANATNNSMQQSMLTEGIATGSGGDANDGTSVDVANATTRVQQRKSSRLSLRLGGSSKLSNSNNNYGANGGGSSGGGATIDPATNGGWQRIVLILFNDYLFFCKPLKKSNIFAGASRKAEKMKFIRRIRLRHLRTINLPPNTMLWEMIAEEAALEQSNKLTEQQKLEIEQEKQQRLRNIQNSGGGSGGAAVAESGGGGGGRSPSPSPSSSSSVSSPAASPASVASQSLGSSGKTKWRNSVGPTISSPAGLTLRGSATNFTSKKASRRSVSFGASQGGAAAAAADDDDDELEAADVEFTSHAFDIVDIDHNIKYRLAAPNEDSKQSWLKNITEHADKARAMFEKKDEDAMKRAKEKAEAARALLQQRYRKDAPAAGGGGGGGGAAAGNAASSDASGSASNEAGDGKPKLRSFRVARVRTQAGGGAGTSSLARTTSSPAMISGAAASGGGSDGGASAAPQPGVRAWKQRLLRPTASTQNLGATQKSNASNSSSVTASAADSGGAEQAASVASSGGAAAPQPGVRAWKQRLNTTRRQYSNSTPVATSSAAADSVSSSGGGGGGGGSGNGVDPAAAVAPSGEGSARSDAVAAAAGDGAAPVRAWKERMRVAREMTAEKVQNANNAKLAAINNKWKANVKKSDSNDDNTTGSVGSGGGGGGGGGNDDDNGANASKGKVRAWKQQRVAFQRYSTGNVSTTTSADTANPPPSSSSSSVPKASNSTDQSSTSTASTVAGGSGNIATTDTLATQNSTNEASGTTLSMSSRRSRRSLRLSGGGIDLGPDLSSALSKLDDADAQIADIDATANNNERHNADTGGKVERRESKRLNSPRSQRKASELR